MEELIQSIKNLAEVYSANLKGKIEARTEEMKADDNAHYLIYRVLGISLEQGQLIDSYQNTGRFLYKYAGSFLEASATLCLNYKFPEGIKTKVENTIGQRPKTFEVDFLNDNDAIEVKWKDATTDGDHITKEHTRVQVIKNHGYKPIRIMFFYPQRTQAIRIQQTLKTLYAGVDGEYYGGDEAWDFLKAYSGVDLKAILTEIANERTPQDGN
ncbi:restriction endonuclease [Kaistella haifensis DSM 19056]|uniref:Restriction endonuclease n=1 Tax=Kaistella haifensis DSM 19056 TaxID=1450526 RepID=A0A246BCG0_9FLAO|nr:ApaLI family restriction endonuclease [Kaistella haifensis]OWK99360.1 restriction endonuclease [Kaistella haifensis DSM 19056]